MKWRLFSLFLAAAGATASAQLANPGAEAGDLSSWTSLGPPGGIFSFDTAPVTILPNRGNSFVNLSSDAPSYGAGDIELFLGLPSGTFATLNPSPLGGSYPDRSSARQSVFLNAEAKASLGLFFATTDYDPFAESSFFAVSGAGFEHAQLFGSTESVGSYGSKGWRSVSFTAPVAGDYTLGAAVFKYYDPDYPSYVLSDTGGKVQRSSRVPESTTYGWVAMIVLVCILVWNRRPQSQADTEI